MEDELEQRAADYLSSVLGFNGERIDPVLGGYHQGNGYRLYSPSLRRFTSPDSMSPFGQGGINPYAYCEGDPINNTDPTGHGIFSLSFMLVMLMGPFGGEEIDGAAEFDKVLERVREADLKQDDGAGPSRRRPHGATHDESLDAKRARQTASQQAAPSRPSTSHISEGTKRYVDFINGDITENFAPSRMNKASVVSNQDLATAMARDSGWFRRVEHGGQLWDEIMNPLDMVQVPRGEGLAEISVTRVPVKYKGKTLWTNVMAKHGYSRVWEEGGVWKPVGHETLDAEHPAVLNADYYPDNPFVPYRRLHAGRR